MTHYIQIFEEYINNNLQFQGCKFFDQEENCKLPTKKKISDIYRIIENILENLILIKKKFKEG